MPSNTLKDPPSVPCERGLFISEKNTVFWSHSRHKTETRLMYLTYPTMVCSYHYSCIDLPVALVDFQTEGSPSRFHHVCQGEYVILNYIDFDGAEQKIYCDCVDKIRGRVKPETLKKMGDSTVYGTGESEEDE